MIRAIIVDDEELSIMYLENKLKQFSEIQVIEKYNSVHSVLELMKTNDFDVVFLDIELTDSNGITLAENMLSINPDLHIIFVSAHPQYAVEAFEFDSVDYLLKPVITSRLEKTIRRVKEKFLEQQIRKQKQTKKLLTVRSFGDFSVYFNNEPVHFKTKKVKELFALLLAHHHDFIHRDIIIDSLWPEHDYKKAKTYLHTCLSHLRRTLVNLGFNDAITFQDECYFMTLSSIRYDADQLEQAYSNLESVSIQDLAMVEELYTGRYLEINDYPWSRNRANELQQKFMEILDELIMRYWDDSPGKALSCLQKQRLLNPYNDMVIMKTLQLLIKIGQRSEALQLYEDYAELIDQDLGISPTKELLDMYISVK